MYLSALLLAILLFLMSGGWLGWFVVSSTLLGVVALITAFLLLLEGGPLVYKRFRRD